MATALLQFVDGVSVNAAGHAILTSAGHTIHAQNADDTGVATWKFELVEIPPGSALTLGATQGPSSSLSTYTFTPDVPGTYRIRLTVTPGTTGVVDIRNVVVPFPRRGVIAPPYQGFPEPLPLPQTSDANAKPDELNIGGQARGWMGDDTSGVPLLYQVTRLVDNVMQPLSNEVWVDPGTAAPSSLRNGSADTPFTTVAAAIAVLTGGGVIHLAAGDYSSETVNMGAVDIAFAGTGKAQITAPNINFTGAGTARFSDCIVQNGFTGSGNIFADRVSFPSSFSCLALTATSCSIPSGFASVGAFSLIDCDLGGDTSTGNTAASILRSRFTATVNITFTSDPGVLTLDEQSLTSYITRQCATGNGTVSYTRFNGPVWTAYSPAIDGATPGSTGSFQSWYRIVGDTCHTRHVLIFNGTGASVTGPIFFPLPLGLVVDETKLQLSYQTLAMIGGRDNVGSPLSLQNPMATWSGGSPEGLTIDDVLGTDFTTVKPKRVVVLLDMPFKIL